MHFTGFRRLARSGAAMALTFCLLAACGSQQSGSKAADVSKADVRRLPPDRSPPDIMLLAADRGRLLGSDSAPVRLYVVSDYQCTGCRTWFDSTLPVLRRAYVDSGKVRIAWMHYPLREHPNAVAAASAAMCAGVQGKFWEASSVLFATASRWGTASKPTRLLDSLASVPGVDRYTLELCTDTRRMYRQIRMDIDAADTLHAGAPPLLIIGKRAVLATTSLPALRAMLDSAVSQR